MRNYSSSQTDAFKIEPSQQADRCVSFAVVQFLGSGLKMGLAWGSHIPHLHGQLQLIMTHYFGERERAVRRGGASPEWRFA